jgi:hypothetical protein
MQDQDLLEAMPSIAFHFLDPRKKIRKLLGGFFPDGGEVRDRHAIVHFEKPYVCDGVGIDSFDGTFLDSGCFGVGIEELGEAVVCRCIVLL